MLRPRVIWYLPTFQSPLLSQWSSSCEHARFVPSVTLLLLFSETPDLAMAPYPSSRSPLCRGIFPDGTPPLSILLPCLWHTTLTQFICLPLPGIHPHVNSPPCHHRLCGQEAGISFALLSAVSLACNTQEVFNTKDEEKFTLLVSCYHVRSYVTVTLFGMSLKLYSCNFSL